MSDNGEYLNGRDGIDPLLADELALADWNGDPGSAQCGKSARVDGTPQIGTWPGPCKSKPRDNAGASEVSHE